MSSTRPFGQWRARAVGLPQGARFVARPGASRAARRWQETRLVANLALASKARHGSASRAWGSVDNEGELNIRTPPGCPKTERRGGRLILPHYFAIDILALRHKIAFMSIAESQSSSISIRQLGGRGPFKRKFLSPAKQPLKGMATSEFLLALCFSSNAFAQNLPAVHWVNDAGHDASSVLNTGGVFVTSFKTHHDLEVTPLSNASADLYLYVDSFGGAYSADNPWYVTQFVGSTNNGTGDGVMGNVQGLGMTWAATGSLQCDFLAALSHRDRILLVDIDGDEQYVLQAFVLEGSSYNSLSLTGWVSQGFSGTTGSPTNWSWPVWDPAAATLTSGTWGNLYENLVILTPDRNLDRLVITKLQGSGWSTVYSVHLCDGTVDDSKS